MKNTVLKILSLLLVLLCLASSASCSDNGQVDTGSDTLLTEAVTADTTAEESSCTEGTDSGTAETTDTAAGTETAAAFPDTPREEDYIGVTNADPALYANLNPSSNQTLIVYDFNGGSAGTAFGTSGTVTDSATKKISVTKYNGFFTQTVTDSSYICPHSMGDKNYLVRSGYVLYGYNTKADGSGEYYGCGWNVPIVKGEKIVLYAQWAKETVSSDFTISGTVLKSYKGSSTRVVIPAGITEIAAGAFKNCAELDTVIMPKSLTKLNSGSFENCPKLRCVYQSDLVIQMPNDTFKSCDAFDTLRINNANSIKYLGGNKQGSYMQKFQRLLVYKNQKKIILIGGSNLCYGLDSATLKEKLGDEYEIINYGTMYYSPSVFFVDLVQNFITEGDIVLMCPEEEPWQWGQVWKTDGTMNYASYLMYYMEGCMEVFSYSDMSLYRNLLTSIAAANKARSGGKYSYESVSDESVNQYGDFDYARTSQSARKKTTTGKNGATIPTGWSNTSFADWYGATNRAKYFTASNVSNLNRAFDLCKEKGAKIFISYSVCDSLYVSDDSASTLAAYDQAVIDNFVTGHSGTYLISTVSDYLFDDSCFYNSMHHLLSAAATRRTELLYRDIAAQLAKIK